MQAADTSSVSPSSVNINRPVFDEPREYPFSNQQPDIIVRPDSGTIGLAERRPEGGGLAYYFRIAEAIGYIEGESAPGLAGYD